MNNPDQLLLIGGTMALLLAVAGFVLTQRNAWKAILILVALFGGLNIGVFLWSELLVDRWMSFRLYLFWIAALLPPLLGLGIGAAIGALVNWRISKIKPTHNTRAPRQPRAPKTSKKQTQKPRIID